MKNAPLHIAPPPTKPPASTPDPLGAALDCCQHIQVLALLLQRLGSDLTSKTIDPLVISNSGHLIWQDIEHLRQLLSRIQQPQTGKAVAPSGNGQIQLAGD